MTARPFNGADAWHRAIDTAARLQAEANADAEAIRKRQLASGTIPAPTGEPSAWTRTINASEARAKEIAAEEAETSRDYYARAARNAGTAPNA